MSRVIDLEEVDSASDLTEDELLYLVQREGTTQAPKADVMEDIMEDVDEEEVRALLQAEPDEQPKKRKRKKSAAAKAKAKAEEDDNSTPAKDAKPNGDAKS